MKFSNLYGTTVELIEGDSRIHASNLNGSVDLIVTSPPYADARKNHYDSVHPDKFAEWFTEFSLPFWTALKPEGSMVINIKDKVVDGVRHRYVWRMMDALCDLGWYAIDDYIWNKTNPMPGKWPSRLRDGWEYCFHLSKSKKPYMNQDEVRKPIGTWVESRLKNLNGTDLSRHNSENRSGFGRDISKWVGRDTVLPSNVLTLPLVGRNKGHPAVYPVELPEFFIKLLSPVGGIILDPFAGSGTTGLAATRTGRNCLLIENNPDYCQEITSRMTKEAGLLLLE